MTNDNAYTRCLGWEAGLATLFHDAFWFVLLDIVSFVRLLLLDSRL
jgi:hypothetical protein